MGLYQGAERCIRFMLLLFLHKANVCSKEWKVFQKFLHLHLHVQAIICITLNKYQDSKFTRYDYKGWLIFSWQMCHCQFNVLQNVLSSQTIQIITEICNSYVIARQDFLLTLQEILSLACFAFITNMNNE